MSNFRNRDPWICFSSFGSPTSFRDEDGDEDREKDGDGDGDGQAVGKLPTVLKRVPFSLQ